jgi:hypothetical protein
MNVSWSVYHVNGRLEIDGAFPELKEEDGLLYINYFGVKEAYCQQLSVMPRGLILDLTQSFFFTPPHGADAFNSARKFFGVPDGGYVFGDFVGVLNLPRMTSWLNCEHLLRRLEGEVGGGYEAFKANEEATSQWATLRMSVLAERLIDALDFDSIRKRRAENFRYLHQALAETNRFSVLLNANTFPLCYPYLVQDGAGLKQKLIAQQIFVPTYWPKLESYCEPSQAAQEFQQHLVCLPIDQRYGVADMARIVAGCL